MPRALRGFWDELTDAFGVRYGEQLVTIENEASSEFERLLSQLSKAQLEGLLETIRARRGLLSSGPAYQNEVVSISKQILTFGAAGIGLTAAFAKDLNTLPPLFLRVIGVAGLFYLNLIVLSLYSLFVFLWQSRFRYPFLYFRKIGNAVPFFYYQTLSPETPRSTFQTADEKCFAAKLYSDDLLKFLRHLTPDMEEMRSDPSTPPSARNADERCAPLVTNDHVQEHGLRSLRRVVRDELQQYFLVIAYQGYTNQYEVRMNNQFLYGFISSAVGAAALAVYSFVWR